MKNAKIVIGVVGMMMTTVALGTPAANLADIALPTPRMEGGMPLMQALSARQTGRVFSTNALPVQMISNLLWAGFGINRIDTGQRTAPSARNWQEVDIYVILKDGAYIYDAKANRLKAVVKGDLREVTGKQDFVATAPLNLVYVADISKMEGATPEGQALYSATDVGFISQNVYLFCASEGLVTVVRGLVDRDVLSQALNLSKHKKIILTQTVGYQGAEAL